MNENIEKLVACIPTDTSGRWVYIGDMEKFAELIVKECVDIADEYDGVGSTIVSRIKKHFGVEE